MEDGVPWRGAGRYAPSPTGDLHMGNLRTAVLAWLFARTSGRRLLLRVEDLDQGRVRAGLAERQRADLEAFGLAFDGPVLRQSERSAVYSAALDRLHGRTFECFCSRRDIVTAASAPHDGTGPASGHHYPGTCRHLTAAQRAERRRQRRPALRLDAGGAEQTVPDLLWGEVTGPVDDVVLQRNDGTASYHLAVVLDDAASGIDQVVRGADLLDSALSQAYLGRLLGHRVPTYAHVPLVLGAAGGRLAKRDGAVTLRDLGALGVRPAQVLSRIAASLGLAESGEPVGLGDLATRFDPAALPRQPWVLGAEG